MAQLAAGHVAVEVLLRQAEASREALDDACQPRAMRLPGGYQAEHHGP
jgi:hypothetical protein